MGVIARGSFLLVCLAGCAGNTGSSVTSSARATTPRDDPADCIDPQRAARFAKLKTWHGASQQSVDEQLAAMQTCSSRLSDSEPETISVRVDYTPSGAPREQIVLDSTLTDCDVSRCVKEHLAKLHAAPQEPEDRFYSIFLLQLKRDEGATGITNAAAKEAYASPSLRGKSVCRDETPDREGHLDPKLVGQVLNAESKNFGHCYGIGLGHDQKLSGKVMVSFVIQPDGHVTHATVDDNTLGDCAVTRCLTKHLRKLSFPPPDGGPYQAARLFDFTRGH